MEQRHLLINWELLSRYASGQADAGDRLELKSWLENKPENRQILDEVIKIFETDRRLSESDRHRYYDVDKAFAAFKERISYDKQPVHKKRIFFRRISAAAGVLALLGFFAYLAVNYRYVLPGDASAGRIAGGKATTWHRYTADPGHFMSIELGDGTSVRLAPGSRLEYPASFGDDSRLVRLEGEAFFDVTKDARHPFVVQTGTFSTTVLGTSFNIEAYSKLSWSKVTLITGKIAISRNAATDPDPDPVLAILTPNESITLSNNDTSYNVSKVKKEQADAIKGGKLVFDGTPMKDVAYKIELYYGVKVQLENEAIERIAFTGTFEHMPLSDLTEMIAEATGLSIEQKGDVVAIRSPK